MENLIINVNFAINIYFSGGIKEVVLFIRDGFGNCFVSGRRGLVQDSHEQEQTRQPIQSRHRVVLWIC